MKGCESLTVFYILLCLVLIIAVILSLYIKLFFEYNSDSAKLLLKIGPVKLKLLPKKEKKSDYRRLAKKLRGKKLSKITPKKKKKKKKSSGLSDISLESFINDLSEHSKNPELTRIALNAIKEFVFNFKNKLHSNISTISVHVDGRNAAATCIQTELVRQAVAYFVEFINCNTSLSTLREGAVQIIPVFDNSGYRLYLKCDFKVRILHLVTAFLKSAFKSIVK